MKRLLTLTLFLGLAWAQSELIGTWVHETKYSYDEIIKIYKKGGRQYIEFSKELKSSPPKETSKEKLPRFFAPGDLDLSKDDWTSILYDPWFGESYYENQYLNLEGKIEKLKIEVIPIDRNTILIGKEKYDRQ